VVIDVIFKTSEEATKFGEALRHLTDTCSLSLTNPKLNVVFSISSQEK